MPYRVDIDHSSRTIAVTGFGRGNTADTLQLIADQHDTFRDHPGYNLIYDSSALEIESSAVDMMSIAEALFAPATARFRKFAIVVPLGRIQLARIFTALADPYGIDINVFEDLAEARSWLGIE